MTTTEKRSYGFPGSPLFNIEDIENALVEFEGLDVKPVRLEN